MAFGHVTAEPATLPLAEVDLPQVGLHDRGEPEPRRQRGGGLVGAAERRDVDGVDPLVGQPLAHPFGLLPPLGSQPGVVVPVDLGDRDPADHGGRLAVAHEEHLRRAWWSGEAVLSVLRRGHRPDGSGGLRRR